MKATVTRGQSRGWRGARLRIVLAWVAGLWLLAGQAGAAQDATYVPVPCRPVSYHSALGLDAQRVCMNLGVRTHGTTPGTFLFLTPGGQSEAGAGIFRDNGQLVWWHPGQGQRALDLTVVHFRGQPYLALWSGHGMGDAHYDRGKVTLYNEHYQKVGLITAGHPFPPDWVDSHEFVVTPQGDALIGFNDPVRMKVRGYWTTVLDYVVQKIALVRGPRGIRTGRVLFQWKSLSGVPLRDSYWPDPGQGGTWDYFHGNSIAQDTDGNLIISGRNTWGVYKVSVRTGRIIWQLGGKGDHRLPHAWCYQHDVIPLGGNRYSLFDDGGGPSGCLPGSGPHWARGLIVRVKPRTHPARVALVRAYRHRPEIVTLCCGGLQRLGGGDVLIDWGQTPVLSQYTAAGQSEMDLSLSEWSYRAFRFPWTGRPLTRPSVAGRRKGGGTEVWASWNGATDVTAWQVLGGSRANHLAVVRGSVLDTGFETTIRLPHSYRYVRVRALGPGNRVLAASQAVATAA
jgi:hypothetical protein